MPRKSISDPIFVESKKRWKVEIPASLSDSGVRVRSFFKTRSLARDYIEKISDNTSGDAPATISPSLAMEAAKARQLLDPWNLDLVQAARIVSEALTIMEGTNATLLDAAKIYRNSHNLSTSSVEFETGVQSYLCSRSDLRETTQSNYRYTLQRVFRSFGGRKLSDITVHDIEAILAGKGPTACAMHIRNLGVFWRWASKPPRNWALLETFESVERPRISRDADISILNSREVEALLRAAEYESSAAAVSYALAIFAGIRMAELERLTWGAIGEDHIEIGKAVAKKHARRLIPISPTLRKWLDTYRGDASGGDSIVPANWRDLSKSVRRRAGWDVSARLLENPPNPSRGRWPANSPRHTCASILVALGTTLESLVFQFGHSGGHDLLRAHYVSRMTRKEANHIMSIEPTVDATK